MLSTWEESGGEELAEGDGVFLAAMAALTAEATAATKTGSRACCDEACEKELVMLAALDDTRGPVDEGEQLVPKAIEVLEKRPADRLLFVE